MSYKVEEKVTEYASGDVTKEVKIDGHPTTGHHVGHPQTTQHVDVVHDGKRIAEREKVIDHHGHGEVGGTHGVHQTVGNVPVPAAYVDPHGGAHPVVEAYQEGKTHHGHEYHERVDVVHKGNKEKIKGDNEPNVRVLNEGHVTAHNVHGGPVVQRDTTILSDGHGGHVAEEKIKVRDHGETVEKRTVVVDDGKHHAKHGDHGHDHGHGVHKQIDHTGKGVEVHNNPKAHTGAVNVVDPSVAYGHGQTVVDHHGNQHVVGPTGGILNEHGRETSNIVDMANQIKRGDLPPNAQVKAELQPLQQHLLEKERTSINPETELAMRNTRKLVEAVETTIDTKNSGDKFQRLVDAATRVSSRTTTTSAGSALTKETREFIELVKDLVIELGKSKCFRKALLDLFTLLKDIIYSEVDVDSKTVAHQSFVEGDPKSVGAHIKNKTAETLKDMPEHHKRDISAQLKTLLIELRDHKESANAIRKTLRLGTLLNKELSAHISHAQVDPDVKEVEDLAIAIIQSFALGVDIRAYLIHLERAIEFVQNEVILRQYLSDCASFLNRSIEHPETIDSDIYIQEAELLVRNGRQLANLAREHPIIGQVMDEASALVYAIKSDEQLNDIKYHASKVAESLTYTDNAGKSHVNFDVISTMRSELVPFLIERIREVQVPGFRMEKEGKFEYLEVQDLYVTLGDILPDRIRIKSTNDTDLTLEALSSPLTSTSFIKFYLEGLRPEFKDFYFNFKRTGKVIKLKDEGRADLKIKGKGINIYITFALETDTEHRVMLGKHKVELEMGPIDLDITQAEHKKMLNMASSMFAPKIKTAIESALLARLEAIGGEWATILNKRVLSVVPSISTLGARAKETLQSQTQGLGKTHHTDTHHTDTHHTDTHHTDTHHTSSLPTTKAGEVHTHVQV